jgi:hypothetical protein
MWHSNFSVIGTALPKYAKEFFEKYIYLFFEASEMSLHFSCLYKK